MDKNKYETLPSDVVVGNRVREVRKKKRKAQADLAAEIGMSPTTLRKIENGEKSASLHQLNEIAKYLKVDASIFIGPLTNNTVNIPIENAGTANLPTNNTEVSIKKVDDKLCIHIITGLY